jgi:hypothetical protein
MRTSRIAALAALSIPVFALSMESRAVLQANPAMALAATAFLGSLSPEQRGKAQFDFVDAERLNWHFIPRERRGLSLKEMSEAQRTLAHALLQAGVSAGGYRKVQGIIELEKVLREMTGNAEMRDPERYFFSVFGTPSDRTPWGWRVEGHHLSLNFTITGSRMVATSPSFMGANPAKVATGSHKGLRVLAAEEDLAREFVTSLDASQRSLAILTADAPRDIITGNAATVDPLSPAGISVSALDPRQSRLLVRLLNEYLSRMADDLAAERRAQLERTDFSRVTFAWAGSIERGAPHYYRIQGPSFLVEYDNTQNNANHIHSVWRDFERDFGRDLLREHYRNAPHPH